MRTAFAHDAVLAMAPDADAQAPGAAITIALCGHWEHEPPCPLAAHHSQPQRNGRAVRLRVLFATEPTLESEVRRRIDQALAGGRLRGPDGDLTLWKLRSSARGVLADHEAEHAARLTRS